jgi:hypothetical protein
MEILPVPLPFQLLVEWFIGAANAAATDPETSGGWVVSTLFFIETVDLT